MSKIQRKMLRGVFAMAMLILVLTALNVGIHYYREKMSSYTKLAFGYTKAAAQYIDGDRIEKYLESLEEDDYYRGIQNFLRSFQSNTEIRYFYTDYCKKRKRNRNQKNSQRSYFINNPF